MLRSACLSHEWNAVITATEPCWTPTTRMVLPVKEPLQAEQNKALQQRQGVGPEHRC